jgi:hypothetical protein
MISGGRYAGIESHVLIQTLLRFAERRRICKGWLGGELVSKFQSERALEHAGESKHSVQCRDV